MVVALATRGRPPECNAGFLARDLFLGVWRGKGAGGPEASRPQSAVGRRGQPPVQDSGVPAEQWGP